MTLYELTAEYMQILEMAEDGADPDIIATHLADIGGAIEEKADSIAIILTMLSGEADLLKGEEDRLMLRRKSLENNAARLKQYLEDCMRTTGKTKFKTIMHSFGIQKNPPSVRMIEGVSVPDTYLIPQEPKVDKKKMLADLKAGVRLDCAELFQSEGLRIR